MRQVQLFIDGQSVELFNDETISLTQTIQNVKDIGKVFANFTQSFNLPATKANNKIFKHYYNYEVDNGFDARKKVAARIELNHLPFQTGKIKLDGVQLKDNKAYSYKVTFYGEVVDLKDILGDDLLGSLTWLGGIGINYTPALVSTHLQAGSVTAFNSIDSTSYTGGWTVPLISNTTRIFYDSSVTPPDYFNADGTINPVGANLYPSANYNGVYYQELSYGMRVWLIVKAIEESYDNITFSSDSFIKQTSNPQFYNLYMWMLREKGYPFKPSGTQSVLYNGFTSDLSSMTNVILLNDKVVIYNLTGGNTVGYTLTITSSGGYDYVVTIKKDGVVYDQKGGAGGIDVVMTGFMTNSSTGYQIYIESTADLSVNYTAQWELSQSALGESHDYGVGSNVQVSTTLFFNAQEQVPNMKVLDFLTGLFKMFNLTATKNADGEIVIKTLDDYYTTGTTRDITKYVDANGSQVDVALPFKDITFQYKGRGTKVAKLYEQTEGIGWGTVEYKVDNKLFGETYTVETPFEHLQYEKFDGVTVQTGSSVDDSDKSYYGSPVLFYPYRIVGGTSIRFVSGAASASNITNYTIPMNSVDINSATNDDTCHFSVEINEYTPTEVFDGSLFANYYQTYIEDTFNPKRRLTKVKAKLPVSFLTNYSLADIIVIANRKYRINSITTNLNTGESDLELLNIV
jgi:hypothetical protein